MHEKRPITIVAIEIFRKEGRPLHYKELTRMLLNICNLTGKTPHESVRSRIGTDERFKRIAEGVYALTEWEEYPVARFAKDIAFDILKTIGKPISVEKLGKEILKERTFIGSPKQIARNVFNQDKRFYYESDTGLVGLVEWRKGNKS